MERSSRNFSRPQVIETFRQYYSSLLSTRAALDWWGKSRHLPHQLSTQLVLMMAKAQETIQKLNCRRLLQIYFKLKR